MRIIKKHIFDKSKDELYIETDNGTIWASIVIDKLNKENQELEYYYIAER